MSAVTAERLAAAMAKANFPFVGAEADDLRLIAAARAILHADPEIERAPLRERARQVHAAHDLGHQLGAWPNACALCAVFPK